MNTCTYEQKNILRCTVFALEKLKFKKNGDSSDDDTFFVYKYTCMLVTYVL